MVPASSLRKCKYAFHALTLRAAVAVCENGRTGSGCGPERAARSGAAGGWDQCSGVAVVPAPAPLCSGIWSDRNAARVAAVS